MLAMQEVKVELAAVTDSSVLCLYLPMKPLNGSFDYISCSLSTALFVKIEYNSRSCKTSEKPIVLNWNIIQIFPWESINLLFHLTNVTLFLDSLAECVVDVWGMQ